MASDKNKVDLSGTYWRHYKGNKYCLLLKGKHTDDESNQFVYAALKEDIPLNRWLLRGLLAAIKLLIKDEIWVRSQEEFVGLGDKDGLKVPRFRRLS